MKKSQMPKAGVIITNMQGDTYSDENFNPNPNPDPNPICKVPVIPTRTSILFAGHFSSARTAASLP